jgi:hypothetical protein
VLGEDERLVSRPAAAAATDRTARPSPPEARPAPHPSGAIRGLADHDPLAGILALGSAGARPRSGSGRPSGSRRGDDQSLRGYRLLLAREAGDSPSLDATAPPQLRGPERSRCLGRLDLSRAILRPGPRPEGCHLGLGRARGRCFRGPEKSRPWQTCRADREASGIEWQAMATDNP